MANTLRIKRRAAGGAAGAPAALAAAELAFNEQDNVLYYGKGNSGGNATSIISIGGAAKSDVGHDHDTRYPRYDAAQSLTTAQQVQARQNVFAAPLDVIAFSGMQVNGAFDCNLEYPDDTLRNIPAGAIYAADLYRCATSAALVNVMQCRSTTGFATGDNGLQIYCPTANTTLASNDVIPVAHYIEGFRTRRLYWGFSSAQPITVCFWVKGVTTGTFTVSIHNNANNRCYVAPLTINAASTWEYKTVTIPGDTSGTWERTNLAGIRISLNFAVASNLFATPNTWSAGNLFGVSGQTHFFPTNGSDIAIRNFMALPGSQAPAAADQLRIARHRDLDMPLVQRQWQKSWSHDTLPGTATYAGARIVSGIAWSTTNVGALGMGVPFIVPMRAAPSVFAWNPVTGGLNSIRVFSGGQQDGTGSYIGIGENGFQLGVSGLTGLTANSIAECALQYAVTARL